MAPSVSMILASPIGTSLTGRVSFPLIFIAAALVAFLSLVTILPLQEPEKLSATPRADNPKENSLLHVVRLRGVWAASLATLTVGLTYGAIYSFLPLFARDRGMGNAGFFFTALGTVVILTRLVLGRVSDKVGRVPVILPMFIILAISMVGLNWTYGFAILLLMALVNGLGFAGTRVGLDSLVVDTAPGSARATALGVLYICFDTGIGAGSVLMGTLANFTGYGNMYLLVGVACVLTTVLFAAVMRR